VIDAGADAADPAAHPGLLPAADIDALVETIHRNSHGESLRATGAAASNLDLYQVNCTFYDAMARDDLRYLLARAIQFFLPGIPQVYYVGLLAGRNDMELLARTHTGRDINRRHYTRNEIDEAMRRPVVQDLFALMKLRNTHPAFGGSFQLLESAEQSLALRWTAAGDVATLHVDLATGAHRIECSGGARGQFQLLNVVPA
jgi:sucrose phosphorylase